jgi:hypothetical protein
VPHLRGIVLVGSKGYFQTIRTPEFIMSGTDFEGVKKIGSLSVNSGGHSAHVATLRGICGPPEIFSVADTIWGAQKKNSAVKATAIASTA